MFSNGNTAEKLTPYKNYDEKNFSINKDTIHLIADNESEENKENLIPITN